MKTSRYFRWMRLHGRKAFLLAGYTVIVVLVAAAMRPQNNQPGSCFMNSFPDVLSLPPLTDHLPTVGQFSLKHWRSNPLLPRRINQTHYAIFIDLLRRVDQVFRKWDIPYMMTAGTLIGSYFHHDMIPWDDDVDLVVAFLRRKDVIAALESIGHPYKMHETKDYYKVYRVDGIQVRKFPWRWPSLDIFRFVTNSDEMWGCHKPTRPFPLSAVVPLTLRPFGPLWLPAPNNAMTVLATYYDFNVSDDSSRSCLSNGWLHLKEAGARQYGVPCSRLMNSYPFVVSRQRAGDGLVLETLRIGKVILQKVTIPAASSKQP